MIEQKPVDTGPWDPGLNSSIPRDILPLSTMFRAENVETTFQAAHELSAFSGLSPFDIAVFRPERLIIHDLLIRVTTTLSVPDGPDYEELGINLRTMVHKLYETSILPELDFLCSVHEAVRIEAGEQIGAQLGKLRESPRGKKAHQSPGVISRLFGRAGSSGKTTAESYEQRLSKLETVADDSAQGFRSVCSRALVTVVNSISGQRGRLVGDDETIVALATGLVLNDWASRKLAEAVDPLFEQGVRALGYRYLPSQDKPVIMNVKGASAAGKSTVRPKQRDLAERLGIAWEDFALVSPDYWRKYLLNYETLGDHRKYGAMLTGHELAIIDRKLDRQMAHRAETGRIPHLLIDRFRFDSFNVGDDQSSQLLTRFGDTVFMFYMITPPEETVERAWLRGLKTGRYKAVDDLLYHNIEAYTGMPALFFSWATSSKKVHHEFLDNSVAENEPPKTVAFGWNGMLTILDLSKLLDIERYKRINVEAKAPQEVYLDGAMEAQDNVDFLRQCAESIPILRFADQTTGHVFGVLKKGNWVARDVGYLQNAGDDGDLLAGLKSLGWDDSSVQQSAVAELTLDPQTEDCNTLGNWGPSA